MTPTQGPSAEATRIVVSRGDTGRIEGLLRMILNKPDSGFPPDIPAQQPIVVNVTVRPESQRQGIASDMVKYAESKGLQVAPALPYSGMTPDGAALFNKLHADRMARQGPAATAGQTGMEAASVVPARTTLAQLTEATSGPGRRMRVPGPVTTGPVAVADAVAATVADQYTDLITGIFDRVSREKDAGARRPSTRDIRAFVLERSRPYFRAAYRGSTGAARADRIDLKLGGMWWSRVGAPAISRMFAGQPKFQGFGPRSIGYRIRQMKETPDYEKSAQKAAKEFRAKERAGRGTEEARRETSVTEQGKTFKTGQAVTFGYIRGVEAAPYMGEKYQQDIEPAGRYMIHQEEPGKAAPSQETGTVTFQNPLVIPLNERLGEEDTRSTYDGNSWKAVLSRRYDGKTGAALSRAIIADGFDGIVTVGTYQGEAFETREIVDITHLNEPRSTAVDADALPRPPDSSPYSDESFSLVKVSRTVATNRHDEVSRIYKVSFDPDIAARMEDGEVGKPITSLKMARAINASPERVADWRAIYDDADRIIDPTKLRRKERKLKPGETNKLAGVEVVTLTKGCQRAETTIERVHNNVLPAETRIEACYEGDCWVNWSIASTFGNFENMEVRSLQLADPAVFPRFLTKGRIAKYNKALFLREGYSGDSSHLIATGIAVEWFKALQAAGVTTKTILISAGYAPVTDAQYKALLPYRDMFELHFSVSGWFHRNELMLRLGEFDAAKKAGLPAYLRIITNVNQVHGVDMTNYDFLKGKLRAMRVSQNEVLETPFHYDALPGRVRALRPELWRSEPTGDWDHVCCETHACATCLEKCMTAVPADAPSETASYKLRPSEASLSLRRIPPEVANEIDDGRLSVSVDAQGNIEPVTPGEIVNYLAEAFGLTIRGRATHVMRSTLAWYSPHTKGARLREVRSITSAIYVTARHIDHHLNNQMSQHPPSPEIRAELMALGRALHGDRAPAGGYKAAGWAEFFREYLTGERASEIAPALYEWFTNTYLPVDAEVADKVATARRMIFAYRAMGAHARVEASISYKASKGTLPQRARRASLWMDTMFRDELAPLRRGLARVGIMPGDLRPDLDPVELAVAYADKAASRARQFVLDYTVDLAGHRTGPGLREVIAPVARQIKPFIKWMKAVRALDLLNRGINPGISRQDAQQVYDDDYSDEWMDVAREITAWNHRLLDYAIEGGSMAPDVAQLMKDMNPIYIPFFRAFEPGEMPSGGRGGGRGIADARQPTQAIRGSDRPTIEGLEAMIGSAEKIIVSAHKADVARALAALADREGMASLIEEVPAPMVVTKVSADQLKRDVTRLAVDRLGVEPEDIDSTALSENWDDVLTVYSNAQAYYGKESIVTLVVNGEQRFYQVDPDVYQVIKGLERYTLPPILDFFFGKANRMLRLGATGLNAQFGLIRNAWRDAMTFTVLAEHAKYGPISSARGIVEDIANTESAKLFKALGGKMSGQIGHDRTAQQHLRGEALVSTVAGKSIYHVTHPVNALRELFGVTEAGTRIGEFTEALKYAEKKWGVGSKAASIYALNAAQDVTTNFTRHGRISKALNQMIPFFNAQIQGPDKIIRSFRKHFIKTLIWAVSSLTIPALWLWWLYKDEEWYKKLPAYEKANYLHFRVPGKDTIVRLPVPFELGHLFQTIPVAWMNGKYQDDPEEVKEALGQAFRQAQPFDWPAAVGPVVDVLQNKDFAGRPIIPTRNLKKLKRDQVKPHTTQLMRLLSSGIGKVLGEENTLAPAQLEHMLNNYSGGLYGRTTRTAEQALSVEPRDMTMSDVPVIGTLFLRDAFAPKAQIRKFYDRWELLEKKHGSDAMSPEEFLQWRAYGRAARSLGGDWKALRAETKTARRASIYRAVQNKIEKAADDIAPDVYYLAGSSLDDIRDAKTISMLVTGLKSRGVTLKQAQSMVKQYDKARYKKEQKTYETELALYKAKGRAKKPRRPSRRKPLTLMRYREQLARRWNK